MIRIIISLFIFLFFLQDIHAQHLYVDRNPNYTPMGDWYVVDSVAYGDYSTVLFVSFEPQKGQLLTFSGAFTSYTWNLINSDNHLENFPLQLIKNLKKDGQLIRGKELIHPAEQYFEEANAVKYSAEFVYEKLPETIKKVDIVEGLVFNNKRIKISALSILNKYGIKVSSAENEMDSLENSTVTDEFELLLADVVALQNKEKYDKSIEKIQKAISSLDTINNSSLYSKLLLNEGNSYYYLGDWKRALKAYEKSLFIEKRISDSENIGVLYNNIASVYSGRLMVDKALEYYRQALIYYKEKDLPQDQAQINYSIGNLYYSTDDFDNALKHYNNALGVESKLNNEQEKLLSYNNIGVIYYKKQRWGEALQNYFQSLDLAKKYNKKQEQAITLNNIGNVKFDEKQYSQAVAYYNQSKRISNELQYLKGLAVALHNEANAYMELNKTDTAKLLLTQSLQIAQQLDLKEIVYNNYKSLAYIYASADECSKSLDYYKKYAELRFSVSEEKAKQINILHQKYVHRTQDLEEKYYLKITKLSKEKHFVSKQLNRMVGQLKAERLIAQYHKEKQSQKIKLLNQQNTINKLQVREKERDLSTKRWQLSGLAGILFFGILLVILLIRANRQSKRVNKLLEDKNIAITKQKEKIEDQKNRIENHRNLIAQQKQSITDSIVYARRIQQAVLPPKGYFNEFLPENFVFYRPRDIVSGDFYWINQQNNKVIIAAGDCTGHGVPGAFLSMLGISYLNRIVGDLEASSASLILEKLRNLFISSLHQTGKEDEAKDGMDIAIVVVDLDKKSLNFAGAYNPMYIVSKNETYKSDNREIYGDLFLHEWRGDKMPIGIHGAKVHEFTNREINYSFGDSLYLFSDGFVDQFGGANGRKYLAKRFKQFLLSINNKTMEEQQILVQKEFDTWRAKRSQIDDVVVLGFNLM